MKFLKQVRELRKEKGWTQARLAEVAGLHQSDISLIESGKSNISEATLSTVAAALDVEVILVPRRVAGNVQGVIDRFYNRHRQQTGQVLSVRDEMFIPDDAE